MEKKFGRSWSPKGGNKKGDEEVTSPIKNKRPGEMENAASKHALFVNRALTLGSLALQVEDGGFDGREEDDVILGKVKEGDDLEEVVGGGAHE